MLSSLNQNASRILILLVMGLFIFGTPDTLTAQAPLKKEIRLHVIALDMKDKAGLEQLRKIAEAAHGRFITANDVAELKKAFQQVSVDLQPVVVKWPKDIIDGGGQNIDKDDLYAKVLVYVLFAVLIVLLGVFFLFAYYTYRPGYILHLLEPNSSPRQISFYRKQLKIGRDTSCDVVLRDPYASKYHMLLITTKDGVVFKDQQTGNGCFINGEKIINGFLPFGSKMIAGKTQMVITRK